MTLIITELSFFGIAMAADTAETVSSMTTRGSAEDRAFFGLTKLLPINSLNAGISYWGWAKMPPQDENGVWMDWWLRNFLVENRSNYNTISDLADILEKELRKRVPPLTDTEFKIFPHGMGGIHIAGYIDHEGKGVPCFWHIPNGLSQALPSKKIDPKIVNANYDCPPGSYLNYEKKDMLYRTRNGDIEPYARFLDRYFRDYLDELNREMNIVIPLPTLEFRAELLRTEIRFISSLYSIGGLRDRGTLRQLPRGIGGEVTTLTINNYGIQSYQSK